MASAELISVVMPTYNRADFLGEAIDSVLAQTYPHLELHVVDDGSTDSTESLINEQYGADPRVHYYRQTNQGQSVARNVGLAHAKGQYIAFLDSDNRWMDHRLETQLAVFAERPAVDIVYGDNISIDEQGNEISRKNMRRHSGRIMALLLQDNFISFNTTLTKRKCFDELGGFDESFRVADDYELWLRFSTTFVFEYMPVYLGYYRVMRDQISSDKTRRFASNERAIRGVLEAFPGVLGRNEVNRGWAAFYRRKGNYHAGNGEPRAALSCFASALKWEPGSKATWRAVGSAVIPRAIRRRLKSILS